MIEIPVSNVSWSDDDLDEESASAEFESLEILAVVLIVDEVAELVGTLHKVSNFDVHTKQVPAHIGSNVIPNMQSLPDEAKRLILESGDHIDYVSQCLIFNPETGEANSWVPSISDVFAHDWEV